MPELFGRRWSRTELKRRGGHLPQLSGVRLPASENGPSRGTGLVEFRYGTVFNFEMAIDHGIDAFRARIEGTGNRKTKT